MTANTEQIFTGANRDNRGKSLEFSVTSVASCSRISSVSIRAPSVAKNLRIEQRGNVPHPSPLFWGILGHSEASNQMLNAEC
jgi:hypothetical protein